MNRAVWGKRNVTLKTVGLAAALLVAASAVRAETVFVGDSLVLAATSQCGTAISVGETARFTYRPTGSGLGNGADSYLAYIGNRSSYAMTVPGNTFRERVNYAGQAMSSSLSLKTETGGITGWDQKPAKASADVENLELTATLANFWAVVGCTVTIRSNLLRVRSAGAAGLE